MYNKIFEWIDPQVQNPAYIFALLKQGTNDILLESTRVGKNGRFSYIALDPHTIVKSKGKDVWVNETLQQADPLSILETTLRRPSVRPEGFPLFYDGAIGYLGYNLKNSIVPRLKTNAHDDAHFWDMYMAFPRVIIGFDNEEKKIFLTAEESSNREIARLESILRGEDLTIQKEVSKRKNLKRIDTNVSLEQYGKIFERAKEYILSGDTYQIKISIRHEFELKEDPFLTYLRLRKTNPAPYAAYLDLEDVVLVSCSPEELIRLEGRVAQTRPIGGTYPRGKNPEEELMKIGVNAKNFKPEWAV